MTMGIRDAEILYSSETVDGHYTLVGENFTKWSQVYVNGEKQSRKFINDNILKLKKSTLQDWDVITIRLAQAIRYSAHRLSMFIWRGALCRIRMS